MSDRLTKDQAEAVDEDARIVCETGLHCRESERLARLRILDLKAENASLSEQAEREARQRRILELACRDAETMDAELDAALQRWLTNRGEGEHIQVARAIIEARKTIAGLESERDAAIARAQEPQSIATMKRLKQAESELASLRQAAKEQEPQTPSEKGQA